jgi:hypothetical protein
MSSKIPKVIYITYILNLKELGFKHAELEVMWLLKKLAQ